MGIAIKLTDSDFSDNNLGRVIFLAGSIQGLSISGASSIASNETTAQYNVAYTPATTDETGVEWSIVQGSSIASIDEHGLLTVATNREATSVTIRATSIYNQTIYSEKTISVAQHVSFYATNNITIENGAYGTSGSWTPYPEGTDYYKKFYSWRPLTTIANGNYVATIAEGYSVRVVYSTDGGTTKTRTGWLTGNINFSDYLPSGGMFALTFKKGTGSYVGDEWELDDNTVDIMFPIERVTA